MIITILENNRTELNDLKAKIIEWSKRTNTFVEIRNFGSGESYFADRLSDSEDSTVFFLDIQMEGLSGVDVAKQLRKENYKGFIIFTTAFKEYVFSGYDVHALNYLLKPVQETALIACFDEISAENTKQSYVFRTGHETFLIPYSDIISFSSNGSHSIDILTKDASYNQYSSLSNAINYLPKEFVRVHRGCIINLSHVRKVSGTTITLTNRITIQIGRNYLKDFTKAFVDYSSRFDK